MWTNLAALVVLASPPSGFHSFVLDNGLQVYLDPMPERASVAVVMGYPVGSAGGPPGRRGLTHLVEHLMFRRAGRLGRFIATEHVERVGGRFNGLTYPDRTIYWTVIPPSELERTLYYERERVGFTRDAVTENDLALEKAIVQRELELRRGSGTKIYRARLAAFAGPTSTWVPSAHERDEVGEHSLEEARWFIERFYRPDHAVLAVSGAFDVEHVEAVIRRWFGVLPRPSHPPPKPPPFEIPSQPSAQGLRVKTPGKIESMGREWVRPRKSTKAERRLVWRILLSHEEKFLEAHEKLLHRRGVYYGSNGPSETLLISMEGEGSKSLKSLEAPFADHIRSLTTSIPEIVTDAALAKAKAASELDYVRSMDAPLDRARLAVDGSLAGDVVSLDALLEQVRTATTSRIRAVLTHVLKGVPLEYRSYYHDGDVELEYVGEQKP